ncbi:MAG: PEGA domain-containing protein [Elusimicrobia bacterium]|nr:PEGA domain-containing protein [Elusimicrobiota bacterium]
MNRKKPFVKIFLGVIFSLNTIFLILAIVILVREFKVPLGATSPKIKQIPAKTSPKKVKHPPSPPRKAERKEAYISINSNPPLAKVFINGYFKAKTPADIKIVSVSEVPRKFSIKIIKPGFIPWEKEVVLKKGDTKEYSINLLKK